MGIVDFFKSKTTEPAKTTSKDNIEDFFNIDIHNLSKYGLVYSHTESSASGKSVDHYSLRLNKLEMGLFYEIDIIYASGNKPNIVFKGRSSFMTQEMRDFLSFCQRKYGLDNSGYGRIGESDFVYIERHTFSRMWPTVWIDNNEFNTSKGNFELTLFDVSQNEEKNSVLTSEN